MSSASVHSWLKKGIEKDHRFKGNVKLGVDAYFFSGIRIFDKEEGRVFYYPFDLLEDNGVPEVFNDAVEKVSIRSVAGKFSYRRSGRYSYLSAEGFVDNETNRTTIMVTGPDFNDAKELFFMIRSGKILPTEDWDGEQISSNLPSQKDNAFARTTKSFKNAFSSAVENVKNRLEILKKRVRDLRT